MEQIDEIQSDINKTELSLTVDIPSSLVTKSNIDHVHNEENIPENQENLQECTNNIIQNVLSRNEYDITDSSKEIENKKNKITENIKNVIINEEKQEIINNDTQIDNNQCTKNEEHKENQTEKNESNLKCVEDKSLNKENTNNAEIFKNKDEQNYEKHNVCTVLNIDSVDDSNVQCQALIKTLSETFDNKDQTLHVTNTNADLSKLVDANSEVMVVTVESTEENIVLTVHKKDDTINSDENDISREQKEIKKTEIVNEEFNLIDYTQESDGTIIEVISTEIVDSEISEACVQQDNKEISNHIALEKNSINSTTSEVVNNSETVDINFETEKIKEENKNVGKKYDDDQVKINSNDKTEYYGNLHKINVEEKVIHKEVISSTHINNIEEENISTNETNKIDTTRKKRSVIQDIFDDWGDENAEDDHQLVSKTPDTVEIELKSLLNETKTQAIEENTVVVVEEEITCIEKKPDTDVEKAIEIIKENEEIQISEKQPDKNQVIKKEQDNIKSSLKDQVNYFVPQAVGMSVKNTTHETVVLNQTSSSQTQIMPINRGRSLTNQIASSTEITEALKERLREKQKIVEAPPRPDIFFVKKLTQRLSSKLVGSPGSSLPALIPLPQPNIQSLIHCDKNLSDNTETNKESNSDNKELLEILEGDVDPDWSNLKPPILTEEGKRPVKIEQSGYNTPPKLDPLVERELALKQLLELPVTPMKRNTQKISKKKTMKSTSNKNSKEIKKKTEHNTEKKFINIDLINENNFIKDTKSNLSTSSLIIESHISEKKTDVQDIRIDESRSGRKRKLTEKAREHEQQQNIVKRQKVYKGKVSLNKKQSQENESQISVDTNLSTEDHVSKETTLLVNDEVHLIKDEVMNKQITNNNKVGPSLNKLDNIPLKPSRQNLNKKGSQPIAKRNIVVKKILKQNISSNKKTPALKAKLNTSKKSGPKSKRSTENNGDPKPKKKIINEIDRLLQDEGVVNLLYDVEQPDKKRLVPITKSQAKVMDIQKVQRELKLRKKLVRNAVLRLRTSTGSVSKVSPRSKRASIYLNDMQVDKKIGDQVVSTKQINLTSQEFILPAKIRNAADASIIIRRHSSSSFSSASGSPRVSIDSSEKNEGIKIDETSHSLRSTKRRHSQDEKINLKKSKKKTIQKNDTGIDLVDTEEDKIFLSGRLKKLDSKKTDKNSKPQETDETNSSLGKVITRSNGTTTCKVTSKTKKTAKSKVTFAKANEPNDEEFSKEEDELSACLAEAANALSVVNAGSRSANSTTNRKNKVNVNITKMQEMDNNKIKAETRSQFSNKEINVRRHGNLVQLILTPSSSTKIRNALTIQVMQEFREILSILKKDDDCRVVLLTSTGSSFCEGLELSMLLHTNKEERRIHAQEMADAVKDFIKSLASFNKPIVAGVQGAAVGLGVTMLPLFDLVIASDKATFSTPYGKLGQIAEGAAVFTLLHILGSAIASELLLGGRTLTASEALRAGLVTRVLWPDKFQVELLPTLKAMSEQSSQSMEATKALLRHSLRKKLDAALESETYLLIQHWCSVECQTAMKAYIDGKVQ